MAVGSRNYLGTITSIGLVIFLMVVYALSNTRLAIEARMPKPPAAALVRLSAHKPWKAFSVEPYVGLPQVIRVKVDFPSEADYLPAITSASEGLKVGDAVCVYFLKDVHAPRYVTRVPEGGCAPKQE